MAERATDRRLLAVSLAMALLAVAAILAPAPPADTGDGGAYTDVNDTRPFISEERYRELLPPVMRDAGYAEPVVGGRGAC